MGAHPSNYHITFPRSETNTDACYAVLAAGGNVAVVFGGELPETFNGYPVVTATTTICDSWIRTASSLD